MPNSTLAFLDSLLASKQGPQTPVQHPSMTNKYEFRGPQGTQYFSGNELAKIDFSRPEYAGMTSIDSYTPASANLLEGFSNPQLAGIGLGTFDLLNNILQGNRAYGLAKDQRDIAQGQLRTQQANIGYDPKTGTTTKQRVAKSLLG